jgi:nucleoid-associated protein YejK
MPLISFKAHDKERDKLSTYCKDIVGKKVGTYIKELITANSGIEFEDRREKKFK